MDKFGPEILVIQFGFLIIVSTIFLWLWFSNRRKYQNLKHAIPANIVKSYLDSIIQNSTSLKSQLFRGGGIDIGSIPSIMPLHNLVGGESLAMSGAPSTALMEELNQKKAQLASLESQFAASQSAQKELEKKLKVSQDSLLAAETKIKELEFLLAKSRTDGGGNSALKAELLMVSKERDELRDRLKEFEIIADDLANLKRLQQENEQLKRSLAASGKTLDTSAPAAAKVAVDHADVGDLFEEVEEPGTQVTEDDSALEDFLGAPADEETAAELEASQEEGKPKSEKTPEDLLSEFEKMLG